MELARPAGRGPENEARTAAGLKVLSRTAAGLRILLRTDAEPGCSCPDPDCVVPGAHPYDPGLLAATTDERMVRWWWTARPDAPVVLATGGGAPCAVSLPRRRAPGPSPRSTPRACASGR